MQLMKFKGLFRGDIDGDLIALTHDPEHVDADGDEDDFHAISVLKTVVAARINDCRFENDYSVESVWGVKDEQGYVLVFGESGAGEKPEAVPLDTDLIEFDKKRKARAAQAIRDTIGEDEMKLLGIGHLLSHIE